jgi:hypothetical protein
VSKEVLLAASHLSAVKGNRMVTAALLISVMVVLQISTPEADALADMNDLGTLMLGGFILAVVAAVALTIVRLRIREKKPEARQFISISSRDDE